MNKYIKTDLEQSESYMRAAIMNLLHDIDSGEITKEINLGRYLSPNLFLECLEISGWAPQEISENGFYADCVIWHSPSGKYCKFSGLSYFGETFSAKLYEHSNSDTIRRTNSSLE